MGIREGRDEIARLEDVGLQGHGRYHEGPARHEHPVVLPDGPDEGHSRSVSANTTGESAAAGGRSRRATLTRAPNSVNHIIAVGEGSLARAASATLAGQCRRLLIRNTPHSSAIVAATASGDPAETLRRERPACPAKDRVPAGQPETFKQRAVLP